jgi:hypothetical protein
MVDQNPVVKIIQGIIIPFAQGKPDGLLGKILFNGHKKLHVRDLPVEAFEEEDGLSWLIYTVAYGNHSEVNYNIEPLAGEPVELGMVRVKPFQLVKRNL